MKYTVYIPLVATLLFSCHTAPGIEETRPQQTAPTTVFAPPTISSVGAPDSSTLACPPYVYVFVLPPSASPDNAPKTAENKPDWFERGLQLLRLLVALALGIQLLRTARRSRSLGQLFKKILHLLSEHPSNNGGKS